MILAIDQVEFRYNGHAGLEDITFNVSEGEVLAILGPNGVGKTTLLRCINGILKPKGGAVTVENENVVKMDARSVARRIGYVAQQQTGGRMTAFDAILMGRRPHIRFSASARDLRLVDAIIDRLGLRHLAMRHIDCMSGGELQKVAVGRALVQEPKVLLLDEPTASLDLKNQVEILKLIRQAVKTHDICAVMTLHDLSAALRFADKCLFIMNGAIHAAVGPEQVTAPMIEQVYGINVELHHHNGHPVIIPK